MFIASAHSLRTKEQLDKTPLTALDLPVIESIPKWFMDTGQVPPSHENLVSVSNEHLTISISKGVQHVRRLYYKNEDAWRRILVWP